MFQCRFLLLNIPIAQTNSLDEIQSIDETAEILDNSEDNEEEYEIDPETEFWGHCSNLQVWYENEYDSRLLHRNLSVSDSKNEIIRNITNYFNILVKNIKRLRTPKELMQDINNYHNKWKFNWLDEYLSDLFSVFTTGPAFVYAYFHLIAKSILDIYQPQENHPADYIRLHLQLLALKKLGFKSDYDFINEKIFQIIDIMGYNPDDNFQFIFVEDLLEKIMNIFLLGLEDIGLRIFYKQSMQTAQNGIIDLLNKAWKIFWNEPDKFHQWEKQTVQQLKENFNLTS